MKAYGIIKKNDERAGQFSSRIRASRWCDRQKLDHYFIFTSCYRDGGLTRMACWATYLVTEPKPANWTKPSWW